MLQTLDAVFTINDSLLKYTGNFSELLVKLKQ